MASIFPANSFSCGISSISLARARRDVAEPELIGPAVAADGGGMRAPVVAAVEEETAHAMSRMSPKLIFIGREGAIMKPIFPLIGPEVKHLL